MTKISSEYYSNTQDTRNPSKSTPKKGVKIEVFTCAPSSTRVSSKAIDGEIRLEAAIDYKRVRNHGVEIGKIAEIPDSVLYNPFYKSSYAYLKLFGGKFKVEDNKGVSDKGASNEDICLALYAEKVADTIENVGACYTGVKKAFLSAGIINNYDDMPRGEAKDSISYFEKHPEKFKKVYVSKENLKKLPAGRIVVFTNGDDAGHIVVTNGKGQGMSSSTDNMGWLDYKGKDAKYVVYELTDGWKYNEKTKKLEFHS